jgi:hypothetical protein
MNKQWMSDDASYWNKAHANHQAIVYSHQVVAMMAVGLGKTWTGTPKHPVAITAT